MFFILRKKMKNIYCILYSQILRYLEKPHKLKEYDGKGDPKEHVQLINERLNYFQVDEATKC